MYDLSTFAIGLLIGMIIGCLLYYVVNKNEKPGAILNYNPVLGMQFTVLVPIDELKSKKSIKLELTGMENFDAGQLDESQEKHSL